MKKRQFKYARASNFLCFGEEGIELDFKNLGNIVHIRGINHDTEGDKSASNGVGKSSVPEIPVYALFGKTIKRPKKIGHADIVHNNTDKELYVEFQWDDYRVVRTRKISKFTGGVRKSDGGTLRLWQSADGVWDKDTEITRGGMPATQKYIEEIIGLNYQTFVNVYVFGDDSTHSFLECDGPSKREIVESLLSLEKYCTYHEVANDHYKDTKKQAKEAIKEYETQEEEVKAAQKRVVQIEEQEKQWTARQTKEHADLLAKAEKLKIRLTNSGVGKALIEYNEAQSKIKELNDKVPILKATREKIDGILTGVIPKLEQIKSNLDNYSRSVAVLNSKIDVIDSSITKNLKEINSIRSNVGGFCPLCKREIDESHSDSIISGMLTDNQKMQEERNILHSQFTTTQSSWNKEKDIYQKANKNVTEASNKIHTIDSQTSEIVSQVSRLSQVKEPQANVDEIVIQKELESLTLQIDAKVKEMTGPSPYEVIATQAKKELANREAICQWKREQVLEKDKDLPYLDFWTKAFGDKGIRKYVIDGIIPTLNKRVSHWLQFLMDNKIKLTLNNELEEFVDRYPFDGRPYIYDGLSNGQRRRLMLALAQSFSYIMTLNCDSCPSALFLDEVTMNIDEPGIEGIYRMICELAKERQVFVIDHNKTLLQKLAGCDTITLEMKNGVTQMLKK